MNNSEIYSLDDRALLRVTGEEASAFLQNLVTCDVRDVSAERMRYGCLLTPQGQFLHEFFILPDDTGGYFMDCDRAGRDELLRRLNTYKLRARVNIAAAEEWRVYAAARSVVLEGKKHFLQLVSPASRTDKDYRVYPDPRLKELGHRIYTKETLNAGEAAGYDDFCITLGVPPARAMKPSKDYISALNLDLLEAVSFDKGCFVGQEVTARMEHRALVKKRLLIVEGAGLKAGDMLVQGDAELGGIRAVNASGRQGLGILKLAVLENPDIPVLTPQKNVVEIRKPAYPLRKS